MFTETLYAQGTAAAGGNPIMSIVMMVGIFVVFYFLLIRPQKQQQKKLAQRLAELKKGDKVIIAGSIVAEYVSEKEGGRIAIVKIGDENAKMEVIKSAISAVVSEEQLKGETVKKEDKKEKKG